MQLDAARLFPGEASRHPKVRCVGVTSRGSLAGGELGNIDQLEPVASIVAFKHLHSTSTAPEDPTVANAIVNSRGATGKCATPCNLADPRDADMFSRGQLLTGSAPRGQGSAER